MRVVKLILEHQKAGMNENENENEPYKGWTALSLQARQRERLHFTKSFPLLRKYYLEQKSVGKIRIRLHIH